MIEAGVFLLAGVVLFFLGWCICRWFSARNSFNVQDSSLFQKVYEENKQLHHALHQKEEAYTHVVQLQASLKEKLHALEHEKVRLQGHEAEIVRLSTQLREKEIECVEQQAQCRTLHEKIVHYEQSKEVLSSTFEQLAQKIFEKHDASLRMNNREAMVDILGPFRQQITDFKRLVESSYQEESKERRSLHNEIKNLQNLNKNIADEALNLTQALQGNKKLQGNWGEMVLDRVLTDSGLREGHEYDQQVVFTAGDGDKQIPDVIVHLPNNRDVIIDSKVSLVDYTRYQQEEDSEERRKKALLHVRALRNHIKQLSKKDYTAIKKLQTLDYVLMFIPVEPAFHLALETQPDLFQEALHSNVMLVTPSNLFVVLRTIHHIWNYERQAQNTEKIADKASSIYDKIRGLTDQMVDLGTKIERSLDSYHQVMNKFTRGKGNLIKQAQDFMEMGVKVKKEIHAELRDEALTESTFASHKVTGDTVAGQ